MIEDNLLIFGAGSHARKLAQALKSEQLSVAAFVTTKPFQQPELDGIPVYTWETLPQDFAGNTQIACGIFNRSDAYDGLAAIMQANQYNNILWPWDYYQHLHQRLGWCYWLDPNPKPLAAWQQDANYRKLVSIIADDESKRVIERVIAFRSGEDLSFASYRSSDAQYFNDLSLSALPSDRPVRFLDLGAYDGDTLKALMQHVAVGKAFLLEPDPDNFARLTHNVTRLTRLKSGLDPYMLPLGASDRFGSFMLSGEGESATLNELGDGKSETAHFATIAPLDALIAAETFDCIKVDVEGHDLEALRGMRELLLRSHAVLVVSLYHRPHDIVHLPLAVMELLDGLAYDYFIRQHLNNSFETVLYAIPRK